MSLWETQNMKGGDTEYEGGCVPPSCLNERRWAYIQEANACTRIRIDVALHVIINIYIYIYISHIGEGQVLVER